MSSLLRGYIQPTMPNLHAQQRRMTKLTKFNTCQCYDSIIVLADWAAGLRKPGNIAGRASVALGPADSAAGIAVTQ